MKRDAATYALLLYLEQDERLKVGSLGLCHLPRGYYIYIGSALSGLSPRLRRHFKRDKTPRWHIDYVTAICQPTEVWYVLSRERLECRWSQAARALPGASISIPGFGASDCHCLAHLVHFNSLPQFKDIIENFGLKLHRAGPRSFPS